MVSIYLSLRLDSEYLECLGERYHREFSYETFNWCRFENPRTGMKLPSHEELDSTVEYLSLFLAELKGSLSLDELGRVTYLENSLRRWRGNAHLLYSRAMEFIIAAVDLYYELPGHVIEGWNENTIYLKIHFEDLESSLLELLAHGESKELMDQLLKLMEIILAIFGTLELPKESAVSLKIQNLQAIADLFAVESLLSSRL